MDPKAAIGGLACRLPKSRNTQEFWDNLTNGIDLIGPTRWPEGLHDLPPRIGAIQDVEKFDNIFFNIPDTEANHMNPMLRHLLEVTYECVLDSCLSWTQLRQTKTGLYLACFGSDSDFLETSRCFNKDHVSLSPFLAGELMRNLGITGPSVTVDTACSSSVAALNMAVNDLHAGRCTYAIVASCNLIINPLFSQQMFVLNMLCKEGKSRVFDKDAAGYVRAEGFSAILVAKDAESLSRVYANIVDIGINCDGYKAAGITNPSSEMQAKLMREMYTRAEIDVNDVGYVEAHGTGTQAGDKAETAGIAEVFCKDRREPLLIGSLKSNMGHSEATAGLASIVKCILAMHHRELPGNLNYNSPNPEIQGIADGKLKVVDKPTPLTSRYIGINSFGFGGVNGHVILEPYTDMNKEDFVYVPGHLLIPVTARNFEGVHSLANFVSNNRYNTNLLSMLSHSLLSCDPLQPYRGYIQIGPKEEDFIIQCEVQNDELLSIYVCLDDYIGGKIAVSSDLMEMDSFMLALKKCSQSIRLLNPDLDIISLLQTGEPLLSITKVGMLAATALLISMIDCLEAAVCPYDAILGCGLSEIVAAYQDNCISLDQCFAIIHHIGKEVEQFSQLAVDRWQVYEVTLDVEQAYQLGPRVQVLTITSRDHVTISVETAYKEKVLSKIHDKGGFYNLLPSNVPIYSGYMAEVSQKIKQELKHIIPNPQYRSCHLLSGQCTWNGRTQSVQHLYDADYISKIICKPVNLYTALKYVADDIQVVRLLPSSCQSLYSTNKASGDHDVSGISQNQSMNSESQSRGKHGLRYNSLSAQSALDMLDETDNEGDYSLVNTVTTIECNATAQSLCHTLGELHIKGFLIDVSLLYPECKSPLGIETPCLSPLVRWDHGHSWNIPQWMEFSCRVKDEKAVYTIEDELEDDDEHIHTPLAVLLYHSWKAICEKFNNQSSHPVVMLPVQLTDLVTADDSILTNEMVADTTILVHPGTKTFAAIADEQVLMKGHFEIKDEIEGSFHLPSIPGYDLDINENVQLSPKDSDLQCEKTEIAWEDDWLEFINEALDFATLHMDAPLREITVDSNYHRREAKECPNFLAVMEKCTGICRSGGCVLQFSLPLTPSVPEFNWSQVAIDNPSKTSVAKVMVYSLYGNQSVSDRVIVYQANKQTEVGDTPVLGLINVNGTKVVREIPLPVAWSPEDLDVVIPYMLASHILYDVAKVKAQQTLLILPPIDTVGVYIISLASQEGCSVFTSTYDVENLQCLEATFPHIRVLHGDKLDENIMMLTQGRGVDLCIKLSGGDVNHAMEYVSENGHVIQCIAPAKGEPLVPQAFTRNKHLSILRPLSAVADFMDKTPEDIEALMFNMKGDDISKLSTEGFPECKGILYNQENMSSFIQPLLLDRLMSLILDPGFGNHMEDLMETDILSIEKIQSLVAPKPKDYSLTDTSCVMRNPLQKMAASEEPLNLGMMQTPTATQNKADNTVGSVYSPEIHIISLLEKTGKELKLSPVDAKKKKKPSDKTAKFPPTSTPLVHQQDDMTDGHHGNRQLEESYLDNKTESASASESFSIFTDSFEQNDKAKTSDASKGKSKTDPDKSKDDKVSKDKKFYQDEVDRGVVYTPGNKKGMASNKGTPSTPKMKKNLPPTLLLTDSDLNSRRISGIGTPGYERPGTPMVKTAIRTNTFQQLMQKKDKPVPPHLKLLKPRVDLLQLGPPLTPMTPSLKELLTPKMMPNLVPLNPLVPGTYRALYIVHPVTGVTKLLEPLGGELKIPCYGIQRSGYTPSDSIASVASYYRNAIEMQQPCGPYRISGYSFGAMIAMEIALQLQAEGKQVEKLILLDGSPAYIQSQIAFSMKRVPVSATKEQIEENMVSAALLNWMTFYGPVKQKDLTFGLLRKLPTIEDKIVTAVDLTFGDSLVSPNPRKTKWLMAKEKLIKKSEKPNDMATAAKELIRLKRKEKATDFISHVKMAYNYKPSSVYQGDIYLHRVKTEPIFDSLSLPTDYGLQELCSGKVHLKFYVGDHESFLTKDALETLTKDVHDVLGVK